VVSQRVSLFKGANMNAHTRAGRKKILIFSHEADGIVKPNVSIQCFESRHNDCNSIVQEMGMFRGGKVCECPCHKSFISPGDINYKIKRRKYASFQNSLNRRNK